MMLILECCLEKKMIRDESNSKVKMRKKFLLDDIDNLYSKFTNS